MSLVSLSIKLVTRLTPPISNIALPGYQPVVFDCSDTSHGGTGFYIRNAVVYNKRDDLKFYSSGDFESTFIEIKFPNKKNMIIGCIYHHPSSSISILKFNKDAPEPVLDKSGSEEKTCALMGDFNIDILKVDINDESNTFYNNVTPHFFTPFILQPTRLKSKTLIDNIFINSIEYPYVVAILLYSYQITYSSLLFLRASIKI